jgi:hypothetical protein
MSSATQPLSRWNLLPLSPLSPSHLHHVAPFAIATPTLRIHRPHAILHPLIDLTALISVRLVLLGASDTASPADMLPAPEVFSPVPMPVRASALPSARTVTRESFTPSRSNSNDYSRYSPRPRQTSSSAPLPPASVTVEDVNDASSDLGDASATGALGDPRKKRRRKKNSKASRRSVVFSDDEPEVIGSASDWAMESGEESGGASVTNANPSASRAKCLFLQSHLLLRGRPCYPCAIPTSRPTLTESTRSPPLAR